MPRASTRVLGQPPLGLGEPAHPARIEHDDHEAGVLERVDHLAFVAAAGFHADPRDLVRPQPGDQFGQSVRVTLDLQPRGLLRPHRAIEPLLADIDAGGP